MLTIDRGHNINNFSDICGFCKHYNRQKKAKERTCKAFEDGIPIEIWSGKNKHVTPYKGQKNKIVFEEWEGE